MLLFFQVEYVISSKGGEKSKTCGGFQDSSGFHCFSVRLQLLASPASQQCCLLQLRLPGTWRKNASQQPKANRGSLNLQEPKMFIWQTKARTKTVFVVLCIAAFGYLKKIAYQQFGVLGGMVPLFLFQVLRFVHCLSGSKTLATKPKLPSS